MIFQHVAAFSADAMGFDYFAAACDKAGKARMVGGFHEYSDQRGERRGQLGLVDDGRVSDNDALLLQFSDPVADGLPAQMDLLADVFPQKTAVLTQQSQNGMVGVVEHENLLSR